MFLSLMTLWLKQSPFLVTCYMLLGTWRRKDVRSYDLAMNSPNAEHLSECRVVVTCTDEGIFRVIFFQISKIFLHFCNLSRIELFLWTDVWAENYESIHCLHDCIGIPHIFSLKVFNLFFISEVLEESFAFCWLCFRMENRFNLTVLLKEVMVKFLKVILFWYFWERWFF